MKTKIYSDGRKEIYQISITREEAINIWASLLINKSQHKTFEMPITDGLIRDFSELIECPF